MKILRFMLISFVLLMYISSAVAQTSTSVQCGAIVESEFTVDDQPHNYVITMAPGDSLQISANPLGDTLKLILVLTAPNDALVGLGGDNVTGYPQAFPSKAPTIQSGILSARGNYTITAYNASYIRGLTKDHDGGIGVYTLYIGCTLRDGTEIAPGDIATTGPENPQAGNIASALQFSGVGFPGLPPVDFANGIAIPFVIGQPNNGSIAPAFESVFGFTLEANAGDKLDLTFTRLSGNLNLGLAVLSAENQIVYQASLVNAERMNALFTLPTAGTYTIGVFKIDLISVDAPENTAFQLTGVLNP